MDSSVEDHKESKRGKPVPVSIKQGLFSKKMQFLFFLIQPFIQIMFDIFADTPSFKSQSQENEPSPFNMTAKNFPKRR